jgi:hypothetical protein
VEKMNLNKYMFATLVVIFALLMIGIGLSAYDSTKGSHDTLWTNYIEPKTGDKVIVAGNLEITGDLIGYEPGNNAVTPNPNTLSLGMSVPQYVPADGLPRSNMGCRGLAANELTIYDGKIAFMYGNYNCGTNYIFYFGSNVWSECYTNTNCPRDG